MGGKKGSKYLLRRYQGALWGINRPLQSAWGSSFPSPPPLGWTPPWSSRRPLPTTFAASKVWATPSPAPWARPARGSRERLFFLVASWGPVARSDMANYQSLLKGWPFCSVVYFSRGTLPQKRGERSGTTDGPATDTDAFSRVERGPFPGSFRRFTKGLWKVCVFFLLNHPTGGFFLGILRTSEAWIAMRTGAIL